MPARARVHVEPEATPSEPPRTLVNVVQALANEALERAQRDVKMLRCAERIANGVEQLIALQRGPIPTVRGWSPAAVLVVAFLVALSLAALYVHGK